ncbi:hypothetical protein [Micromonospora fulviviridis]|uniref:Uncharacterized protein n=1 Tax=Micromonospora fulviviridis TaxID=47860 RepID=A0ABV2VVR0_9ACTN
MPNLIQRTTVPDVFVDASTIDLTGESLIAEFEPEWNTNGLVEADPDGEGVRIICGQETGHIAVTAELWDSAPPLDADGWQDIAEVSTAWASRIMDFGTTTKGEDASVLRLPGPGDYRLRVHGKNRDDEDPRSDTDPVEEYLIQVWPAPRTGPQTIKSTSRTAAGWLEQPEP